MLKIREEVYNLHETKDSSTRELNLAGEKSQINKP